MISNARNLYRQRWALNLSGATVVPTKKALAVRPDVLRVLQRFNGGMVYSVAEHNFLLIEHEFGGSPFLLVFALRPRSEEAFREVDLTGPPDAVLRTSRVACETVLSKLKLPDLYNIEVDLTKQIAPEMNLPNGWRLAKAILKVAMRSEMMCDVDGPCGYCCEVCESCYLCC
jgi:hypothetical protein